MPISITDNTTNPLVTAGQSLTAFNALQVTDAVGMTETVTISLSYSYFSYYSPNADFGSISDPNGGGQYDPTAHTFTEAGLVTGDPTYATQLLRRLVYTPPALQNGQSNVVTATVSVADSGTSPQTDPKSITIESISTPLISGTVANEPVSGTAGSTIRPFATAKVIDTDFAYSAKDTATIKLTDGGTLTDADGLLTGPGLSKTPGTVGTYTLSNPDYAFTIGSYLQNLVFAPTPVASGQRTTNFELDVTDPKAGLTTTDPNTSVVTIGGPPSKPNIAGTLGGQTVVAGNVIKPFASVSISDSNTPPTDTATINLLDSTGKASDANGTLSGNGLTETAAGSGVYTLTAGSPATVTSQLDALTFTPTPIPSAQTSATTQFDLSVSDAGQTATDNKTTVTENPPQPPPSGNFQITDETTGVVSLVAGEPYPGSVSGITQELILATSDNVNVLAEIPNVFIHTGSGNDGIDVSRANGNNILDGGTGSNFLIGGTENDNFYLDDRNPNAPIFSTIVNFHAADNATVWGVDATNFSLLELDNQGATGYTGLDLIFSAPGKVATSFVLAGYTSADLSNGRLSMSYGTTADIPGVPGSEYLTVRAN